MVCAPFPWKNGSHGQRAARALAPPDGDEGRIDKDDFILARAVHVLAILLWIGGVAFVTMVLLPAVRRSTSPEQRLAEFHRVEARFAPQARLWVLAAGLSGMWMTWRADLWDRFADPHFWWMHAMVAVWLAFAAMLFVI